MISRGRRRGRYESHSKQMMLLLPLLLILLLTVMARDCGGDEENTIMRQRRLAKKGTGDYDLCATKNANKCDRLLMRNTFDIWQKRQEAKLLKELMRQNVIITENMTEYYDEFGPSGNNTKSGNRTNTNDDGDGVLEITITIHIHALLPNETKTNGGGNGGGLLTNETIHQLVSTLNLGFENRNGRVGFAPNFSTATPFTFELGNVTHTYNNDWFNCGNEVKFKRATRIGKEAVLNVWLCDTRQQGYVGKATYPNMAERRRVLDGVVLMNPQIPREKKDIRNGTIEWNIVHQVGHWLGLLHPWTGGCHIPKNAQGDPNYVPNPTDEALGDGVSDTPPQLHHAWNERGRRKCWMPRKRSSNKVINTCPSFPDPDGLTNYMGYAPRRCMRKYGHFTAEQILRMQAMHAEYRRKGRGTLEKTFSPRRDDIIQVCLMEATRKCGCDLDCVKQMSEDALQIAGQGASTKIRDTMDEEEEEEEETE